MASTGNTLLALITGAAIGAGVGLLYAPDSGEKTREKLKKDAIDAQDRLNKRYSETSSNLSERAKRARVDFEARLEETLSSASHKADDILAAMETKLDELRKQNSKLQKDKSGKSSGKSGNTPDKAVV
jgi:gas vesicle protein